MKEDRYQLPKENENSSFVAEPSPMYHGNTAVAFPDENIPMDCLDDEDINWDRIPVGWGPANEEEACARIEAIEKDIEENELIDESEMIEHLKAKGLWFL